jgi:hypothetical protein
MRKRSDVPSRRDVAELLSAHRKHSSTAYNERSSQHSMLRRA